MNSMYWIRKEIEHNELSEALRAAARRERRAQRDRERREARKAAAGGTPLRGRSEDPPSDA